MKDVIRLSLAESIVGVVIVSLAFLAILALTIVAENVFVFFTRDKGESEYDGE
jgi:hypothetical protein